MEIKAVFIKQIHFGKLIFNEGDLVKVTLKDECRKGCHILPKEYTGILSQISDSFCCVREGKLATPIEYEEIKSIETASSDNAEDEDYDFEETCPHCDHSNKVKWDKKATHLFVNAVAKGYYYVVFAIWMSNNAASVHMKKNYTVKGKRGI